MTQSVELILDERTEAAVRAQWDALTAAGLPSQGRHAQPSNRPHVTLLAQARIDPAAERPIADACTVVPLKVRLGSFMVFGRGRFVLVRPVIADLALLHLQTAVQEAGGEPSPHMAAGGWVPHVTLAHRMSAEQVGAALALLAGTAEDPTTAPRSSYAVAARRWDGEAKREWPLPP